MYDGNMQQAINQLKLDSKQLLADFTKLKHIIEQCRVDSQRLQQKIPSLGFNAGGLVGKAAKGFSNQLAFNITGVRPYDYARLFGQMLANMISGTRASGGNVTAGGSYIVGERGPEVFTPSSGGTITANNRQLSPSINLVMNINAVDSESFRRSQSQIMAEATLALRRASRNL